MTTKIYDLFKIVRAMVYDISNLFLHTFSIVIAFEGKVWSAYREYTHLSAIRSLKKIT